MRPGIWFSILQAFEHNDLPTLHLCSQVYPGVLNSVAARACVSKTTLYNHPEYRTRIESLRCNCIAPKLLMKPSVTDKGKDVIIAAKNKRIRELEAEVDRLSSILKSFYAKEYEKY